MEVVILEDAHAIAGVAADAIGDLLSREPTAVLGLATGSSPWPSTTNWLLAATPG